jgi:hypothetical protein
MLVYAGIDEAGYGPVLGPLCVGASVFVLDDAAPATAVAPNLWRVLSGAVCRGRRDRRGRLAIDDSKKLKGPPGDSPDAPHALRHLERGVLATLALASAELSLPADDEDLLERLGASPPRRPWYPGPTPLPVGQTGAEIRVAAARLARTLAQRRIAVGALSCAVVDVEDFNRGVAQAGAKSAVNFEAAMRLVEAIWRRWPDADPRIVVDRHGGRTHYLGELMIAFPEAQHRILDEAEAFSRYAMTRGGSTVTITFQTEAESRHLPVALASMVAKYVRDLHMIRLNRFFTSQMPELKPTAGYHGDAQRYLREIEPLRARLDIPPGAIVRCV